MEKKPRKPFSRTWARTGNRTKGSDRPRSLLEEEQIPVIRKLLADGVRQSRIARMYAVSKGAIQGIARGRNWKHVE